MSERLFGVRFPPVAWMPTGSSKICVVNTPGITYAVITGTDVSGALTIRRDILNGVNAEMNVIRVLYDNADIVAGIASGYRTVPTSDWSRRVADNVLSLTNVGRALRDGLNQGNELVIAGHSAGGTMAFYLSVFLRPFWPNLRVKVYTFGSPKPGNERWWRLFDDTPYVSWVNEGDDVAVLPPSLRDFPRGILATQAFAPNVGPRIEREGFTEFSNSFDSPLVAVLTNTGGILNISRPQPNRENRGEFSAGVSLGADRPQHDEAEYQRRIEACLVLDSTVPQLSPEVPTLQPSPAPRLPDMTELLEPFPQPPKQNFLATGLSVGSLDRVPSQGSSLGVHSVLKIPPAMHPKVTSLSPNYFSVNVATLPFAYFEERGKAKTFARKLLSLMGYLDRTNNIVLTDFQASWSAWLVAASTPGSGFVPTITVN